MKKNKNKNQTTIIIGIIIIIVFIFIVSQNPQTTKTQTTESQPTYNQPRKTLNPSINSYSAECCYDRIQNGIVLYGGQISSKGLVIGGGTSPGHANFFGISLGYSGFSKSDVTDIKAYCDNRGKIQYPSLNQIKEDRIDLHYYKNVERTSTDECVVILSFKNGKSLTKSFTIKMIGSKYQ